MTVFVARVIGGEIVPEGDETVDVRWFDLDQLPWLLNSSRRYIADTLAKYPEPVQATLQFSPVEVLLRKIARRVYQFKKWRS